VTNKTLATLLRGLVSKNTKEWDLTHPHVEFDCNFPSCFTTTNSPFESCYGINPLTPLELIPLLLKFRVSHDAKKGARKMKKLHLQVRANVKKVNEMC